MAQVSTEEQRCTEGLRRAPAGLGNLPVLPWLETALGQREAPGFATPWALPRDQIAEM